MIGITHQVKIAPLVKTTSVTFIATSIEIIDTRDIPIAVLKAMFKDICLERINVSNAMDVKMPFTIAKDIIARTGQAIFVN